MSLEDLEQAGVLLPRELWGKADHVSFTNQPALIVIGSLAIAASVLMYWGGGHIFTWIGVVVFLAALLAFTTVSVRTVERHGRTRRRKRRKKRPQDQ